MAKDEKGRLVRLDKTSGEVSLVEKLVDQPSAKPLSVAGRPSALTSPERSPGDTRTHLVDVTLLKKSFTHQDYQDYIFFDIDFRAVGLTKVARAVKGKLSLQDLFGEQHFALNWTIDGPLAPGQNKIEKGSGFRFNQFMEDHQWVRSTDLADMKAVFRVDSILWQDGTRQDLAQ